ncbi:peptidyl-prolyl cis-trans isomerase D [Parvibaculum indicum]|uniref:peptidylprolyl isomerase n=1 Tax=Parvibaculum indicum TaxID=562969 RepID=UPI0014222CEA|nr:peptidylprolyl isomerase [Parvibaculum indicum]NIJ42734.1 peptidyl-prolyl cis-trans isomerase D [Parvibaculum indicum]
MLDTLRKTASGWIGMGLMGLLVVSFAVWGIADIFRGYGSSAVATVGSQEIGAAEYQREISNETRRLSQRYGQPITPQVAQQLGVNQSALGRLIGLAALNGGAEELGLAVSDEKVAHNIMTDPNLQNTFGKFDKRTFELALSRANTSEEAFIKDRREYLIRDQLIGVIGSGIHAPDALVDVIATFQKETRDATYLVLPPSLAGEVAEPDDKALEAYYQKISGRFQKPETRSFSVMQLTPDEVAETISVSEDELKTAFEQQKASFDTPEKRDVIQITFDTKEDAAAAVAKLRSGTPVEDVVKARGLAMEDVELGLVSKTQMLSSDIGEAAFSLEPGQVSDPVEGPLGTVVLKVTKVEPAVTKTFDEVKDELRKNLAMQHAREEIYNIQNSIEDDRAGGMSFRDVAEKNGLSVQSIEGVTQDGKTRDGKDAELPELPGLLETVYDYGPDEQIPPRDNGKSGYYWVHVDQQTDAEIPPLKDVRGKVVSDWKEQQRKTKLQDLARTLAERGNKGESFDKIAAEFDRSVLVQQGIQRYARSDTFSRVAVTRLFATPKGGFTYGPVMVGDSMLVMQVKDIHKPELAADSDEYKKLKADIKDSIASDMIGSMVAGLQQKLGVSVNQLMVEQVTGTTSQ